MNKKIRTPAAAYMLIAYIALWLFSFTELCMEIFRYQSLPSVPMMISIAVCAAVCVMLLLRKFNETLPALLMLNALTGLFALVSYFDIWYLIGFVADLFLVVYALASCEKTWMKADLSKMKTILDKLFYLPALLYLANDVFFKVTLRQNNPDIVFPVYDVILSLLYFAILLSLGLWMRKPYAEPKPVKEINTTYTERRTTMESKFTGGLLGLIGISILQWLLIFFTLGIGTPWAICMYQRWIAKHTVIDGHQLVFDGTGGQLFGKFIIWFLLTLVTLGIYGLWLGIKMQQWITMHTHMVNH